MVFQSICLIVFVKIAEERINDIKPTVAGLQGFLSVLMRLTKITSIQLQDELFFNSKEREVMVQ